MPNQINIEKEIIEPVLYSYVLKSSEEKLFQAVQKDLFDQLGFMPTMEQTISNIFLISRGVNSTPIDYTLPEIVKRKLDAFEVALKIKNDNYNCNVNDKYVIYSIGSNTGHQKGFSLTIEQAISCMFTQANRNHVTTMQHFNGPVQQPYNPNVQNNVGVHPQHSFARDYAPNCDETDDDDASWDDVKELVKKYAKKYSKKYTKFYAENLADQLGVDLDDDN